MPEKPAGGNANGTRGSYDHFGRTLWPSDMRRKGLRPGESAGLAPEDDRRGNLVEPPQGSGRGEGGKGGRPALPDDRRPGRGRRRRRGKGRRGRGGRPQEKGESRAREERPQEPRKHRPPREREGGETAAQATPTAAGSDSFTISLSLPAYPEVEASEAPGRAAQTVVRHYLRLLNASREALHDYYRAVTVVLGHEELGARVEAWARKASAEKVRERVVGRPRLDGERVVVRSSGEGFGPKRYTLRRNESKSWLIESVDLQCPDCEGSASCPLCEGAGCEVCEEGRCAGCRGTGWRPYPE